MGVMIISTQIQSEPPAGQAGYTTVELPTEVALEDVLFEQLEYLIQFAGQERDRLERVKAVLMEPFN